MEAFAIYLLKSAVWLTGFSLIYFLFLRNERFFRIKRSYLVMGILASLLFPMVTIHYTAELPAPHLSIPSALPDTNINFTADGQAADEFRFSYKQVLFFIYILGILALAYRIIKQILILSGIIRKNDFSLHGLAKIVRVNGINSPFSFLNYVFISPSMEPGDAEHIINHEEEHIRQKHWFDLLLAEIIQMLQWVNPFAWVYAGFIRQNHEYLADNAALQRTSDPSGYKAVLLNQMFSVTVIPLSNSFSYSNSKKRFDMMKKIISSPYRKLRILLVMPMAAIIFYAFATPEYKYVSQQPDGTVKGKVLIEDNQTKNVRGKVFTIDGKPLEGATIIVQGTTKGTVSDINGLFRLADVSDGNLLIVTYIGFKSITVKPDFASEMMIKIARDTVRLGSISIPPPPPPPSSQDKKTEISSENGDKPLFIVDGVVRYEIDDIPPDMIESIGVRKGSIYVEKYGEKAKNGVIEITTKKRAPDGNSPMVMVEEMPMFRGGENALQSWIYNNLKIPGSIDVSKFREPVDVIFIVSSTGKIGHVRIVKSVHPLLDAEAIRVVSSMPDWSPGRQNGKPVDVYYMLPIKFTMK